MLPGRKYTPDSDSRPALQGPLDRRRHGVRRRLRRPARLAHDGRHLSPREATVQVLPQRVPDAYVRPTVTSTVEERLKTIEGRDPQPDAARAGDHRFQPLPREPRRRPMDDAVGRDQRRADRRGRAGRGRPPADARPGHRVQGRLRLSRPRGRDEGDAAADRPADQRELADARVGGRPDQPVPPEPARRRRAAAARAGSEARGVPAALRRPPAQPAAMATCRRCSPRGWSSSSLRDSIARDRDRKAVLERLLPGRGAGSRERRRWRRPRRRPARAPTRTRSRAAPRRSGSPRRAPT